MYILIQAEISDGCCWMVWLAAIYKLVGHIFVYTVIAEFIVMNMMEHFSQGNDVTMKAEFRS